MAGSGTKTTSGTSSSTTLYAWTSPTYSPDKYLVQGKSGQTAIYGSPYWWESITTSSNTTIYVGGYYAADSSQGYYEIGAGSLYRKVWDYEASTLRGGTGSNWVSFLAFAAPEFTGTTSSKKWEPETAGNQYLDFGDVQSSLVDGSGIATVTVPGPTPEDPDTQLGIEGTPGVVVNLSGVSMAQALKPLLRFEDGQGTITNYGLVGGLADYLSTRLMLRDPENGPLDGFSGNALFGAFSASGEILDDGLAAGRYAFYARDDSRNYASGKLSGIQNVQGSNDASNMIVGGAASGTRQGGSLADIIIGGSGNSNAYGMGGRDLLVSTTGNDTLYAGQFGRLGTTTPKAALVTDAGLLALWNGSADDLRDLAHLTATTFVAGTGVVTMVGSDAGDDVFLAGANNGTVYGSGLGADGAKVNADDHDRLSFAQIGQTYYNGYKNLTITLNFNDTRHESGTAVGSFETASGSMATLFNLKFFDIEEIFYGSANMVFRDPNGRFYPVDPVDGGFTGGTGGTLNNNSGMIDPGPSTSDVTGTNPSGGNLLYGASGGNTNFDGGPGPGNILDFSSSSGGDFYDCSDQNGGRGDVRNYSLVLDLANSRYTYQQEVDGIPTVFGGSVTNVHHITGTVDCSDVMVGAANTISLTGGGGEHNILYAGGGTFVGGDGVTYGTTLTASRLSGSGDYLANGGAASNWVVFQNPTDLINGGAALGGTNNGSGRASGPYAGGVTANLDPYYEFNGIRGDMVGFANILGTGSADTILGDENDNILVGGGGNDTISGGATDTDTEPDTEHWGGDNLLYGGSGRNRVTGGALDADTDTFVVGYDYNPVAAGAYANDGTYGPVRPAGADLRDHTGDIQASDINANLSPDSVLGQAGIVTTTTGVDTITDWKNADGLYVSTLGTAIIEGINTSSGTTHSSMALVDELADTQYVLDFSNAQNLGIIIVEAGDGDNSLTGSSGVDLITLGDGDNIVNDTAAIDPWNSALTDLQTITVGGGDNTINAGHGDYTIKAGDGDNTINAGNGDNVIIAGNGDNSITVGSGTDKIYAGSGVNTITLGALDNNQDSVYIYGYSTKDNIKNFESGTDKIYFDVTMLRNLGLTADNRAIDANGNPIVGLHDTSRDVLQNGQTYETGNIGILSDLYDLVYRSSLGSMGSDNGAWANNQYRAAYTAGVAANSAVIAIDLAVANALSAIPIVGPIIAIPFFVLGGLMIYDTVGTKPYENRVYNTNSDNQGGFGDHNNPLLGFANTMKVDNGASTTDANWTGTPFMGFYDWYISPGFRPSLEVVNGYNELFGYPFWINQVAWTTRYVEPNPPIPGVSGIHTLALLYDGNDTYIYVVNSSDSLIQENEARLFAKVNGEVKPSDLGVFDSTTDTNLLAEQEKPPIPPALVSVSYENLAFGVDVAKVVDGTGSAAEVQTIRPTNAGLATGHVYVLQVGATTLTTGPLAPAVPGEAVALSDLVAAIQAAVGYGAAPFEVAAAGRVLQLTWKANGNEAGVATLTDSSSKSLFTNIKSGELTFTFADSLDGNELVLKDRDGVSVGSLTGSGTSATFDLTGLAGGPQAYTLTVVSSAGFEADSGVVLNIAAPPKNTATQTDVQVSANALGISVSSRLASNFVLRDASNAVLQLDTSPSTAGLGGYIPVEQGDSATLVPQAQLNQAWVASLLFNDGFNGPDDSQVILLGQQEHQQVSAETDANGNPKPVPSVDSNGDPVYDTLPFIGLGTVGADSFDASGASFAFADTVVYGFGGSDSIKANATLKFSTTFYGGSTANTIAANANGGSLSIDLTGSDAIGDTVRIADGAATVHADGTVAMTISGFDDGEDKLAFTGDAASGANATHLLGDQASPVSCGGGISATVSNGIISFTGTTASTTLADLVAAAKALIVATGGASPEGAVSAFQYEYSVTFDTYDTVVGSATYGQKNGSETKSYSDLLVVHAEGAGAYSVVQLLGVQSTNLAADLVLTP